MARRGLKVAAALLAAAAVAAGGWYWGSPWWTLWRVREAARTGDWARLEPYVDLPAITAQTRAEMRGSWTVLLRLAERNDREFVADARRALAEIESDSFAPLDFRPWLANMELHPIDFSGERFRPYVLRYGLDRFEVRQIGADWETGPMLTFRREGLGWKLVGVRWGQQ